MEIIILTAFGLFEYSQQAIKNRVFDYLLKPVEEKELISAIEKVKRHIRLKVKPLQVNQRAKLFDLNEDTLEYKKNDELFKDNRISKIVNYIMDNLEKDLTLEILASLVHINTSYLSRLFKSTTGVALSNFILEARIEKAKFLLINQQKKPLKIIAEEVGFTNIHHFSNTFKKLEGITPTNYRSMGKGAV